MSKNTNWSVVWERIEEAHPRVWMGFPLLKSDSDRLVGRIRQKYPTVGQQHFRLGLEFDQEKLVDHDVIWVRRL